jgi:quercetin dioxygenase-like cupin family protein
MTTRAFNVTPQTYPPALEVLGETITVLASNAATNGYEVFLHSADEGAGPPPHSHGWDETFYVLSGTIEFNYEGKSISGVPGTLVYLPAGTVHSFRYGPGGAKAIGITGKEGAASHMFAQVADQISPITPDLPKLIALLQYNRVTVEL